MIKPIKNNCIQADLEIFDTLTTPIWVFDIDILKLVWVNQAAVPLWNATTRTELLTRSFADMSPLAQKQLRDYQHHLQQGNRLTDQWTLYPNGQPVLVNCHLSKIYLENNEVGLLVEGTISQSLESEQNPSESLETFCPFNVLISLYTWDGIPIVQNTAALQCYGELQDILRHFADPVVGQTAIATLEQSRVFTVETQVQTQTGVRWHEMEIRRTLDPITGNITIWIIETELSSYKQAEAILARQEMIPDLMIHMNRDGTFLDFVPAKNFKTIMPAPEMRGKTIFEVMPSHIAHQRMQYIEQALTTGELQIYEYELYIDSIQHFEEARITVTGKDQVLVIIRDITDRKRLELERDQAEQALRESEHRYAILTEVSPVGIFHTDALGSCLYVNERWCQIAGLSLEAALGQGWINGIYLPDRRQVFSAWEKAVQTRTPFCLEYRFQRPDGLLIWVLGQAVEELNEQGEVVGYVGTITNISERKQFEKVLQEINEELECKILERTLELETTLKQYRTLVEQIPGVVYTSPLTATTRSDHAYISPQIQTLLGIPADQWQAGFFGSWLDYVHPDDRDRVLQEVQSCIATQRPFQCEYRILTQKGDIVWVQDQAKLVVAADGSTRMLQGLALDINDRKQTEESRKKTQLALQQSEAQYRRIVETASEGIWEINADNHTVFVNQRMAAMLGYETEEMLGMSLFEFMDEDGQSIANQQLARRRQGEREQHDFKFQCKDGSTLWAIVSTQPIFDETGQYQGALGLITDISDRKRAEEALREREAQLQSALQTQKQAEAEILKALEKEKELGELKSRFVSMISHEFRTPLTTIQSSIDLLQRYPCDETEKQELFQQTRMAVQYIVQLLEDILLIGRAESIVFQPQPTWIDLKSFCEQQIESLKLNSYQHCSIHFEVLGEHQPAFLDEEMLQRILINLLTNAIKYSSCNSLIFLRLIVDNCSSKLNQFILQVQDYGIGIPPEDLPHVFEFFHRAKNVGTISGTGLGLAIVKKCVDACRGKIWIESEVGVGTTVTVVLPQIFCFDDVSI